MYCCFCLHWDTHSVTPVSCLCERVHNQNRTWAADTDGEGGFKFHKCLILTQIFTLKKQHVTCDCHRHREEKTLSHWNKEHSSCVSDVMRYATVLNWDLSFMNMTKLWQNLMPWLTMFPDDWSAVTLCPVSPAWGDWAPCAMSVSETPGLGSGSDHGGDVRGSECETPSSCYQSARTKTVRPETS